MANRPAVRWIATKVFVGMAREAYHAVVDLEPRLQQAEAAAADAGSPALEEWGKLHNAIVKQACTAIVFATAAAEAYIYDYGARHSSDSFVKKYVDKLNLVSKWVVIPQLVTGREFPRDRQGIELLRALVNARNELVHFKSGPSATEIHVDKLIANTKIALEAIEALARDMDSFDPNEHPHLQLGGGEA